MHKPIKVLYTSTLTEHEMLEFNSPNFVIDPQPFIIVNSTFDKEHLKAFAQNYSPDCLIITSQNAREGLFYLSEINADNLSVLTLSEKIADGIKDNFKSISVSQESNVESLAEKAKDNFQNHCLLHLNGNLRKNELKNLFMDFGLQIQNYQVYTTDLIQPEIELSDYDAVAFLSYSGIDSFFSKYHLSEEIPAFTIGKKTSQYLKQYFEGDIITTSNSSTNALIKTIKDYFSND